MGREIRRVPANWEHPKDERGRLQPKFDRSYRKAAEEWRRSEAEWNAGIYPSYASEDSKRLSYTEWAGEHPDERYYMPEWPEEQKTHYQMYETCSEGTPISPVFATPEEVARYCADNDVSSFAHQTATYEQWLAVARGGWAPSAVVVGGQMMSGVEFAGSNEHKSEADKRMSEGDG